MDSDEAMRAAELGEAEYMYRLFAAADPASRDALGMAQLRVAGGEVTVMAADPTGGFWSRAIGLGITQPLDQAVVDEVLDFTRGHGGRSVIFQIAPGASPPGWTELLARNGAAPGSAWVKCAAEAGEPSDVRTDLKVDVLGHDHADEYAHVICAGFEMPLQSPLPGLFQGVPDWGAHGFTTYGAWDDGDLVAAATLFVANGVATLSGAATLPSHRGRGAQSALMARRIRDAAARGCRWLTAETGAETPEAPNPSLHNMRRLGLQELYVRQNWVWRG
jgi:GNAT superfamily N-acetyltransferase